MGNYLSSSQTSPQLLGISFIENHKFYFSDNPDTSDVANVVKDAFIKQNLLGETMNLLDNAKDLNKSKLIKKLHNIIGKSSSNSNVSRLAYDLAAEKKNYDEFVKIIKELKHDKRQLELKLEEAENYLKEIRSTINFLYKENTNFKKDNILIKFSLEKLTSELANKDDEIKKYHDTFKDSSQDQKEMI